MSAAERDADRIEQAEVHAVAVQEENDRLHRLVDDLRQGGGHDNAMCADLDRANEDLGRALTDARNALTEAEVDRQKLEQRAERAESERDDEKAALRRVMVECSRLRDQADLMHNMLTAVEVGTQTAHVEPVAEFAHAMLQTGAAIALKHVGHSLDADLADINRRAAADKRVLDAAEALVGRMKQAVGDSNAAASQWLDPYSYRLFDAVDARRALADPEIVNTQPVPARPELREQLAAIEHERWADWQRYLHSKCVPTEAGSLEIPAELVARWERQIATVYADLSEAEKQSDRDQVDRYWPLVVEWADGGQP